MEAPDGYCASKSSYRLHAIFSAQWHSATLTLHPGTQFVQYIGVSVCLVVPVMVITVTMIRLCVFIGTSALLTYFDFVSSNFLLQCWYKKNNIFAITEL